MNTTQEVAAIVKAAMKAAERTPTWVARKAGIALTTLNRKLEGGADFTVGELRRIAAALKMPAAALLPEDFFAMAAAS
ncbi:helix-turn-helix domain-containing protein [Microbacterium esteraromaticum]|uniref:helix-turn-helix domain-containing protein n=1 Tax=Microbacterium esteraromaticum TaxID=57043 RepID=UPI0019D38D68|nr:helix-turn-helix domain-containing protein [Microbacterium esteraromaticum]MBN7792393.1 hypothetical protein [Microbacterium esteraromaticum]